MYRQFAPAEQQFGFVPDVTFNDDDPSGAFGSVAVAKNKAIRNYTLLNKEVRIDEGEFLIVKKYKSLLEQFEYDEYQFFFVQADADEDIREYFKQWQTFEYMTVGVHSRTKALRTPELWLELIEQRQEILDALDWTDEQLYVADFRQIEADANKISVGAAYFQGVRRRCIRLMKTMLQLEVELQQKLASVQPQAAPAIYGYDDALFTISMQKLDAEIVASYPNHIPAYLQYQMVALVTLFDRADVKRNDGNVRNYMHKGLRAYAIDVGLDDVLNGDENNTVSKMFFSRFENGLHRHYTGAHKDGVRIVRQALDEASFDSIAQKGIRMMEFLDAVEAQPEEFHFFQLDGVYTEDDVRERFQTAEPLWNRVVQGVSSVAKYVSGSKPALFWGNETWWCAKAGSKYLLSETTGRKIHNVDEISPNSKQEFQALQDDFWRHLPKDEHSIVLSYLESISLK